VFKVLAARIIVFAFACAWVLGLLLGGVLIFPSFLDLLKENITSPSLQSFIAYWYIATIVILGAWVAVKGFKFVGKWEKDES